MLKTNRIYFFDLVEFEEIIVHYLDAGKHSLAKKAMKLGLEQHPESVDLKLLQVELYVFENELDKALLLLSKIEKVAPENEEIFIQKAAITSKQGFHYEAILFLNKALNFTDDKVDVWSLLGMEYLYIDDFSNARLNFTKCVKEDIEDYSALYNIVYCFDMQKMHKQAIIYLKDYIDKNPYCEVAWHQLGRQYFILNRFKDALIAFDYCVLIDEFFIGGYLEKAKTLEELGVYQEAIDNYLITLELDDPTSFAYIRIGECYQKLNKKEAAISYFKKAVHEDPLLDRGWVLLTTLYFENKNYQKAAYYLAKAIEIDEDNPAYWRLYSEINLKLNFFEEAVAGFDKCLTLKDDSLDIFIGLTDVLSFLGEFDDALKVLLKARKVHLGAAEIEYRLAALFLILNKEKYALIHLKNGLHLDYDYHVVLHEVFPTVYENTKVQAIIKLHEKRIE